MGVLYPIALMGRPFTAMNEGPISYAIINGECSHCGRDAELIELPNGAIEFSDRCRYCDEYNLELKIISAGSSQQPTMTEQEYQVLAAHALAIIVAAEFLEERSNEATVDDWLTLIMTASLARYEQSDPAQIKKYLDRTIQAISPDESP
jgi:hypothetical protein